MNIFWKNNEIKDSYKNAMHNAHMSLGAVHHTAKHFIRLWYGREYQNWKLFIQIWATKLDSCNWQLVC